MPETWNPYIYTLVYLVAAFGVITASRLSLCPLIRKLHMNLSSAILWLIGEFLTIILVLTLIAMFLHAHDEINFSELLWLITTDIVTAATIPYIISILLMLVIEKHTETVRLGNLIRSKSDSEDESGENMIFYDRGGKLAFSTHRANVLYVEAADNYCNIHYINIDKENTFILHNSMKHLDNPEKYKGLLRCHRGYMVNIDNVKLLRKDKEGLLLELLRGERSIPVSRTYNEKVVKFFVGDDKQS